MTHSAFIFSPEQLMYKFHDNHPFNQQRLSITTDLLIKSGALREDQIIPARKATLEELLLVHDEDFVSAVMSAQEGQLKSAFKTKYGLGTEDTPTFPMMHDAASWLVGGTLQACDLIFEHGYQHALNLGGGLHHGFRGKASGFCVYNDSSIAIEYMKKKYNARVLYVDTDAHHGDGVQWAFYEDPDVCTLSFHESGRFLFPGTGGVTERGHNKGYGTSFNVPFEAFSEDSSMLEAYEKVLRKVIEAFKPDVILTQNGADSHYFDPLTHLCGTLHYFHEIPKLAHKLAHEYCEGRWIAVGGGGYDIWRVVPRAWATIWLEMTNQQNIRQQPIPQEWVQQWQKDAPVTLPTSWDDPPGLYPAVPRKKEIEEKNNKIVEQALKLISESHVE
ncbi:acetoin utilization protein AcuC [Paenalkalicoccus suaedae]|uniref:Acetoin utilization protein AcuC n=1 Tax=Paenalkalicoccus suaedae TaxID=2592382 RepID=A0A859FIK3_9BACI|nr:acetoin utilization protein AcuC [Paenalkalicoccus suaedae]QKS72076.1 acetoin utilization protein AcuC [Paenalkalicoccus suaedae]